MYSQSKINTVLILSYWICNYVLPIQGETLASLFAKKESDDEDSKPLASSTEEKESALSIEKVEEDATIETQPLPQGNQPSPNLTQVIAEGITNVVVSGSPVSVGKLFYSVLKFIIGKLKKPKKPSKFEEINSDAVYLFREIRDTKCVEDKTEIIQKVTDYIRQSSLFTGRYKDKSKFQKRFEKIKTTANGDCFYSAISLLFFGHESFARGLRAITAAHMAINKAFCTRLIEIFQETEVTWLAVLDIKKFAESVEIVFLGNILCRIIKVYESGSDKWYQYPLIGCESPKEPLHLHLRHQHFSALRLKPRSPPVETDPFELTDLPSLKILSSDDPH